MNISLPEEVTEAMTRGVARGVEQARYLDNVGPMDRLQQGAAAEAMVEAATQPGRRRRQHDGRRHGHGPRPADGQHDGRHGGAASSSGGRPAGPPPLPAAQQFHVEISGQAAGPFTPDQLRPFVGRGQLTPATLVWANGMPGWAAAQTVPALAGAVRADRTAAAAARATGAARDRPSGPPPGRRRPSPRQR